MSTDEDAEATVACVTQAGNELVRHGNYSPASWVLGSAGVRTPGSLLHQDELERLEVQEEAMDPGSHMNAMIRRRMEARIAHIRADNDARYRKALLRQTRPLCGGLGGDRVDAVC